jgi:Pentapeptide repeats (8 copies)
MNDLRHPAPGPQATASREAQRRLELRADCTRCFALCCVAPAFSASADFAIDKAAGQPCPNLRADFRCSIHDGLWPRGFGGCAAFDCLGAGQKVAQVTFGGRDWRADPKLAAPMFAAFAVMRQLHELLWHLNEALALSAAGPFREEIDEAFAATERLTNSGLHELVKLDVKPHRQQVNALLRRVSDHVRERAGRSRRPGPNLRRADLAGKDLRDADLTGATLRGALLIGTDLRGADLSYADLTGADLRGADLSGADLETSLFTTQPQLDSAKGSSTTKLPSRLSRPSHWATAG